MIAFFRYAALVALTVCLAGFLLYLVAKVIDTTGIISGHGRDSPLFYFFTLLTILEMAAFTIAAGRFHCSKRFLRPERGVVGYAFALNLNIIAILIAGRLTTGAMFLSLESVERWRDAYAAFVMHLVVLDAENCNCEAADDVFMGFTFALSCAVASPFVWMITRRFRITAL